MKVTWGVYRDNIGPHDVGRVLPLSRRQSRHARRHGDQCRLLVLPRHAVADPPVTAGSGRVVGFRTSSSGGPTARPCALPRASSCGSGPPARRSSYVAIRNARGRVRSVGDRGRVRTGRRPRVVRRHPAERLGAGRRRQLDDRRRCRPGHRGQRRAPGVEGAVRRLRADGGVLGGIAEDEQRHLHPLSGPANDQCQDLLRDQHLGWPSRAGLRHRRHRQRRQGHHAGKNRRAVGHHRDHCPRAEDVGHRERRQDGGRGAHPVRPGTHHAAVRRPGYRQVPAGPGSGTVGPQPSPDSIPAAIPCAQNRMRAPTRTGNDQRELSLLTSRRPSSTSQSTSDSPPMKRTCASAITSKGPTPMSRPPVGPRLNAHDFSKNLPSCAASPGVRLGGTPTNVPRMSWWRLTPTR